mmetsp:Transcript_31593/g.50984  ORF Transcript_31593/g.50984 Transcript_31593/m.50984 type:complete len:130 (-) Transcript_31593:284-673(-)|eukprot:CAMPEP_0184658932 /NCGR_PEP_ID=MMETSP0308-20130426/27379_1 /TAXON_ID=38269 /ORGANISM="Gloeochaete witrockiana, Strain SAG 46.84" /LENGTH=129 /DNA_ID=CAMNT_0027098299 /DNA_START=153 /DNA_END=542 /DNA_ORIENTATION=+
MDPPVPKLSQNVLGLKFMNKRRLENERVQKLEQSRQSSAAANEQADESQWDLSSGSKTIVLPSSNEFFSSAPIIEGRRFFKKHQLKYVKAAPPAPPPPPESSSSPSESSKQSDNNIDELPDLRFKKPKR